MKKHALILLLGTSMLSACSVPSMPTVEKDIEHSANADTGDTGTTENDYGYATHSSNPNDMEGENDSLEFTLDRQTTADAISRYAASNPGVESATTVVTDEEVLIFYEVAPDSKMDSNETADQVKRSALSVIPRWYHVYLTDKPSLRVNVESIAQTHLTASEMEDAIASTIELMTADSPQGYPVDEGENANGETEDEMHMGKQKEIDLAPAAMDIRIEKAADA
ncbi:hypothetical protein E2R51_07170 [Jeotgalibacillus sp. S-D1]|uniref:YhcN/YlaJ family sporulation lipoprotein n=1 Tax=Jeotgalibacillus sp. S-D1 TaxID=2552189 RepID=UPI0010596F24|nr:YhcN/YlaJ family sporulation lipoprotein [Jeotgalibacillus sp. S-D1]TDL32464.1 hypothetical protein E2R51_07170 [Jeotgalibacillus sp. S-D1]